jgi:HSP20 family protein
MNRLFGSVFDSTSPSPGNGAALRHWIPAMDLVETETDFVVRADLPGLTESDVRVELEDNVLTVAGDRRTEQEERRAGYYRIERASGAFSRALTLPEGIDPAGIEANFRNGVLEIRVPKPTQRKPHRVSIALGGDRPTLDGTAEAAQARTTDETQAATAAGAALAVDA